MTGQPTYRIELNERIKTFDCPDCGRKPWRSGGSSLGTTHRTRSITLA